MPPAVPPIPIYVLDRIMGVDGLVAKPGEQWWEIPCASRRAYGRGDNIQEMVEGLALYARLGVGPLLASTMAILMSADARRRFESELGINADNRNISDFMADATVEVAEEQGVTVIVLSVRDWSLSFLHHPPLRYYLVYDATDRSLSMFRIPQSGGLCTLKPIVPRRTGCSDYKLFLLGREDLPSSSRDAYWVGSLPSSDGKPSKFKSMDFRTGEIHKPFKVDVAFAFQGKGFWGDLEQGLLFCNLHTSGDSDKDFGFIKLPCECKVDEETGPMRNTRTLGCAGDSIWFVCIDTPSHCHYSNAEVCIWELDLPGGQLNGKRKGVQWKMFDKVPVKRLWELPSFKESGLPVAPFQYPILTPDGTLCFVLVDESRFPWEEPPLVVEGHFCSFDMRCMRLLWHGLVHNYTITDSIVMYPSSNFLQMKQCPSYMTMSFEEDRPDAVLKTMAEEEDNLAAGLKAMAWGEDSPAAGFKAITGGVREVVLQFEAMLREHVSLSSDIQGAR